MAANPTVMIPWAKPTLFGNEQEYVSEALASTWISGGPFVDRLEEGFKSYLDVPFAATAANGTAALHLAYLALGVAHGDEVIVPGFAYMGAANIALLCGATPVFVDVDPDNWCMDPADVEVKVSRKTKAIVAIHTYGNLCNMDALLDISARHGIPVIEDAAESLASQWKQRMSGTLGTIGTYSFHATKTVTTGEGGMVVTHDPELDHQIRLYRSHGMLRQQRYYWHEVPGHNFRLTNLQAAMGCAQLENIGRIVADRRRVHAQYLDGLGGQTGLTLQRFDGFVTPVLWAMAVKLNPAAFPEGRDNVLAGMRAAGVECRPGFYAASQQPIYETGPLRVCEDLARNVISLPTFPDLAEEQIRFICRALIQLKR